MIAETSACVALRFDVRGAPVPWQRVTPIGGGRAFVPQRTREFKSRCAWAARRAIGSTAWPLDAEYALTLHVVFPDRRRRDLDNCVKSCSDALNGIAWADDSQIATLHVTRAYDKARPRVEVSVEVMT